MKTQYVCPIDNDVVLFEDDPLHAKIFVFEEPETCPECGKTYFKSECILVLPGIEVDDDEA